MGVPAPFGRRFRFASSLRAALPRAACGRAFSVAVAALRGTRPHDRGSLSPTPTLTTFRPAGESRLSRGGTASAPAPSPRAPPRVVFLLLLAPPIRFAVRPQLSRVPRASGTARSLFEFLACVLRASGCLPALELGAYRFSLPVSRPLSQARSLAGRESFAPAGLPSRAPSPAAALLVGRGRFPPSGRLSRVALCSARSAERFAPSGLFLSRFAGLVSFSPFRLPPASSLCCGCAPRSVRGTRPARWPRLVAPRLVPLYYPRANAMEVCGSS